MIDPMSSERRKYVRLGQQHMLRHEKYVFQASEKQEAVDEGVLKNYSTSGALFESRTKYDIDDILKLEITIPGWEIFKNEFYREDKNVRREPIVVLASVVRVEAVRPNELYDIGVEFVGIDEGDRWALTKQIKKQLRGF